MTWWRAGIAVLASVAVLFLALPVLAIVGRAVGGGSLLTALTTPAVIDALVLSLVTTVISLLLVITFGTPLAMALARGRGRWTGWVGTLVDLPIVVPPSVAGLSLLLVFGSRGLLGSSFNDAGISLAFTTIAVVLAQVFVSAPFFIRSARAGIVGVDHQLEDAARVDGATEPRVARWITLPLAAPALAAGLVMTWARALGEFGATIMFAGSISGRTQTLPLVVYGEFQSGDLEASIAAAVVLILAAFISLAAVRALNWNRALDENAAT